MKKKKKKKKKGGEEEEEDDDDDWYAVIDISECGVDDEVGMYVCR